MLRNILRQGCLAAISFSALLPAVLGSTAQAEPTSCDPYSPTGPACPSRPTGNCDPYSSNGFLGCLGGNWQDESAGSAAGGSSGPPTITNPKDVYAVTVADVYALICNDLDVNGVSVASVEDIYHVLYAAPYGYGGRDAGTAVAMAVNTTCPRHQRAMDEAKRQATS